MDFLLLQRHLARAREAGQPGFLDFISQYSYHLSMKTRVSERGQITIPKAVRDRLGIRPGQELEVREQDGAIVAYKVTTVDPLTAVTGIIETDRTTDDLLAEIRGAVDAV